MKELFRKFIVALKRRPQVIALLALIIAFLYYVLNLTSISNTTAKIQGPGMGLAGFAVMLLSILSIVSFNNAFPHRKKVNIPMLVLMFVMLGVIFFADIYYRDAIYNALTRAVNPIVISNDTLYIQKAYYLLQTHMILLIVGVVLTALLPVYSRLLRKINTSVEVEDNGKMAEIEITGEV